MMSVSKRYCDAAFCTNTSENSDLSFFAFPKDSNQYRLWLDCIGDVKSNRKHKLLCSDHFELWAFTDTFKRRLHKTAIPINMNENFENNCEIKFNSRISSRSRCAYCCVYKTSHQQRFFQFPKDTEMCKAWAAACKKPYILSKTPEQLHTSYKLCSEHFLPSDYASCKMRRLRSSACPSIFKPDTPLQNKIDPISLKNALALKLNRRKSPVCCNKEQPSIIHNKDSFAPFFHGSTSQIKIVDVSSMSLGQHHEPIAEKPKLDTSSMSLSQHHEPMSEKLKSDTNLNISVPTTSYKKTVPSKMRKIKNLYAKFYNLCKKYKKLSRSKVTLNAALKTIEKYVTPTMYRFILSQIKPLQVPAYPQHHIMQDKNLAAQLYHTSPQAYNFLEKHFNLPSRSALFSCTPNLKVY